MKTQTELLYEAYQNVYLSEEDLYFQEIAEFLLDEGFTEEDVYELTEEEFEQILDYIEEAKARTKTQIRQMGLSGRRTRKMGVEPRRMMGGEVVSSAGKSLPKGAPRKSAEKDIEAVRKARAERKASIGKTERQQRIAQLGAAAKERYEKSQKPKKNFLQKLGRVATTLDKVAKAKFQRGIGARNVSDEALRRLTRRELAKEDYFDIVADYLLENFEFDSEEHFYQTMASLDDELIGEIIEDVGNSY